MDCNDSPLAKVWWGGWGQFRRSCRMCGGAAWPCSIERLWNSEDWTDAANLRTRLERTHRVKFQQHLIWPRTVEKTLPRQFSEVNVLRVQIKAIDSPVASLVC